MEKAFFPLPPGNSGRANYSLLRNTDSFVFNSIWCSKNPKTNGKYFTESTSNISFLNLTTIKAKNGKRETRVVWSGVVLDKARMVCFPSKQCINYLRIIFRK